MREQDILLWPDGFWCFRSELSDDFLRDYQYRVVRYDSKQWHELCSSRGHSRNVARPGRRSRDQH